jgi:hypothetical protein
MYRYSAQLSLSGAVEAASLAEAERIIESVLKNASAITVVERDAHGDFDELSCTVTEYIRGRIRAEV